MYGNFENPKTQPRGGHKHIAIGNQEPSRENNGISHPYGPDLRQEPTSPLLSPGTDDFSAYCMDEPPCTPETGPWHLQNRTDAAKEQTIRMSCIHDTSPVAGASLTPKSTRPTKCRPVQQRLTSTPNCHVTVCRSLASSMCSDGVICRICHEGDSQELLIAPCKCAGTMGMVHRSCIEKWLGSSNTNRCEICNYEYITERKPRTFCDWVRSPTRQTDQRNLIGDSVCFSFLTPLAVVSAWLCISGALHYVRFENGKWESIGLLTLSIFLVLVYLVWCVVALRYHYRVFKDWQSRHEVVRVMDTHGSSHSLTEMDTTNNNTLMSSFNSIQDSSSLNQTSIEQCLGSRKALYQRCVTSDCQFLHENEREAAGAQAVGSLANTTGRCGRFHPDGVCCRTSFSDTVLTFQLARNNSVSDNSPGGTFVRVIRETVV